MLLYDVKNPNGKTVRLEKEEVIYYILAGDAFMASQDRLRLAVSHLLRHLPEDEFRSVVAEFPEIVTPVKG